VAKNWVLGMGTRAGKMVLYSAAIASVKTKLT